MPVWWSSKNTSEKHGSSGRSDQQAADAPDIQHAIPSLDALGSSLSPSDTLQYLAIDFDKVKPSSFDEPDLESADDSSEKDDEQRPYKSRHSAAHQPIGSRFAGPVSARSAAPRTSRNKDAKRGSKASGSGKKQEYQGSHSSGNMTADNYAYERSEEHEGMGKLVAILIVIALLVVSALGLWYVMRSVEVTVNGQPMRVQNGTSIKALVDTYHAEAHYGDLVDVAGEVLTSGAGKRYTVTVNEAPLGNAIDDYRVTPGDKIQFMPGENVTEEYSSNDTPIPCKLHRGEGDGSVAVVMQWGKPGKKQVVTGKISGKTVDWGVTEQPKDMIVKFITPQPKDKQKLVALTFNDGPSEYTQQCLDILKEKHAKATFFMVGNRMLAHPDVVRSVSDAGCEVANYSMTLPKFSALSDEEVTAEFTHFRETLKLTTGKDTRLFRAPLNDFSMREWHAARDGIVALVRWDVDTVDWKQPGSEEIRYNAIKNMHPGAIILMHDGGGSRDQSVAALKDIIEAWQEQGYTFVTVSELLKSDKRLDPAMFDEGFTYPKESLEASYDEAAAQ